jgi:hypothetical protein
MITIDIVEQSGIFLITTDNKIIFLGNTPQIDKSDLNHYIISLPNNPITRGTLKIDLSTKELFTNLLRTHSSELFLSIAVEYIEIKKRDNSSNKNINIIKALELLRTNEVQRVYLDKTNMHYFIEELNKHLIP